MESATGSETRDALARLVGLGAWGARVGWGSFLTIEFGTPPVMAAGVQHGQFHLWVYGSDWGVRAADARVTSESGRDQMEAAAALISGRCLRRVRTVRHSHGFEMVFDDGVTLTVEPYEHPDGMEAWMLYMPGGSVLSAGPGDAVEWESAS